MADPPPRKLAVILHADVAGSTALVRLDETLAHQRIQETFRRLSDTITSHDGIAHEIRGDALVAEFSRASDAVAASVAFQAANAAHNDQLADEVRPVVRVGVAMGEVVVADNTVTGEGVVLAQRLEQLARPGGVCLQDAAYQTVPKRLPFEYESLGEQELKGFDEPVRAYLVSTKSVVESAASDGQLEPGEEWNKLPEKPSIAVLPFNNMSGDSDQDYFSDGLTEDIITELSHHRDLFVTARTSSFALRSESPDIVDVGKRLNVRYVLEGSVRKSGKRVRVTAQLIDATTAGHIWADRYDRDVEDIFAVQDEVVHISTSTLIGRVEQAGYEVAKRKPPSSLKAYDCVVQALNHFYKWTPTDNEQARKLFEQAVELDPDYAPAYAWLAEAHFREWLNGWSTSVDDSFSNLFDYATKSVALDDNDSRAQTSLGVAHLFRGEHDRARYHLERALSLNPSDTRALVHLARCEALSGNPAKGVELLSQASRFNPLANYNFYAGQIHYIAHRYDEALKALASLSSSNPLVHAFTAATHSQMGNEADAQHAASLFVSKAEADIEASGGRLPKSWVDFVSVRYPFQRHEDAEHLGNGLRNAGLA